MLVKVHIKRRFKEGQTREVFTIVRKIRALAMDQKGYISGETLINHNDPQLLMVVGTWQSADDWLEWYEHPQRKQLETQLETHLYGPVEIEEYVYGKYYLKLASDTETVP